MDRDAVIELQDGIEMTPTDITEISELQLAFVGGGSGDVCLQ